jgi:hypothetical protein
MIAQDRLFVPLNAEAFGWFASGGKLWELRKFGRQYTEKHVRPGRRVELRRGYSDARQAIWGRIKSVHRADSLVEFFDHVPYRLVIPTAVDCDEAIAAASEILRIETDRPAPVIGFEVAFEP